MAVKTEYRVSLSPKPGCGYNFKRDVSKHFKSLPDALRFAHRAMGFKDEKDPRSKKKRPNYVCPWWHVRISNWTKYETLLSIYLD